MYITNGDFLLVLAPAAGAPAAYWPKSGTAWRALRLRLFFNNTAALIQDFEVLIV